MAEYRPLSTDQVLVRSAATRRWFTAGLLILGGLALVLETAIVSQVTPVSGYELSLLAAYPPAFWLCVGIGLAAAICGFVSTAVGVDDYLPHSIGLVIGNYTVLFFLPILRGYRLYGRGQADKLVHLGEVHHILLTGRFEHLFYPVVHVVVAELAAVGTLSPRVAAIVLSLVLTLLYMISAGLLLRRLANDRRGLPLGIAASVPLLFGVFHVAVSPAILSILLVPLAGVTLDRYRRRRTRKALSLALLVCLLIVPAHPITALFLIVGLATTALCLSLIARRRETTVQGFPHRLWIGILLIWGLWYGQFPAIWGFLESVIRGLTTSTTSIVDAKTATAQGAKLSTAELFLRLVQLYGAIGVYLLLLGAFVLFTGYRLLEGRIGRLGPYLSIQGSLGVAIALTSLFVYVVAFNPVRVSRYLLPVATLSVGGLFLFGLETDRRGAVTTVLALCVVGSACLAVPTVYPVNNHLTSTELLGSSYALAATNDTRDMYSLNTGRKTETYLTGQRDVGEHTFVGDRDAVRAVLSNATAPANRTRGQYLATKTYDSRFHRSDYYFESQREQLAFLTDSDQRRLRNSRVVQKLYTNGGYTLWYLRAED